MSFNQNERFPIPNDLIAVVVVVALTGCAVFVSPISNTFLRPIIAVGFIIFVPGYVLVAAAFPACHGSGTASGDAEKETGGLDLLSRFVFSFGTSIAIATLTGIALGATEWGIRQGSVFVALAGITILAVPVALYRRRQLPPQAQFGGFENPGRSIQRARGVVFGANSTGEFVLNVGLLAVVILAVVAGVGMAPPQEDGVTEFYLLSEGEDGTFTASEHPSTLDRGESHSFLVGVGNGEYRPLNYTVVVKVQRLGPDNQTVLAEREIQRFTTKISHNQSRRFEHTVTPELTGDNVRLVYLLYTGPPPANPRISNAYLELHLWLTVDSEQESKNLSVVA